MTTWTFYWFCSKLVEEFDLIWITWKLTGEYPQTKEQTNFASEVFEKLKQQLPKGKELSVCLPCFKINFSAKELVPFVDFFVLMAYDLVGSWELSGHHSTLFPTIAEHCEHLNKEEMIPKKWLSCRVRCMREHLRNCSGPNQKFSGAGTGSFGEAGVMDYKNVLNTVKKSFTILKLQLVMRFTIRTTFPLMGRKVLERNVDGSWKQVLAGSLLGMCRWCQWKWITDHGSSNGTNENWIKNCA